MVLALIIASCIATAGVMAAGYLAVRPRGISRLVKRAVVVHTRDQHSYRGILVGEYRDLVVLSHAAVLGESADAAIPGELYVLRDNVAYIQLTSVP